MNKAISETVLKQILSDPLLVQQLSDRVIELFKEDLQYLAERSQSYGRRF